jgi:hypothetical protein
MNGRSDQFLACPRFPKDQGTHVRRRHHLDLFENASQCCAPTHDLTKGESLSDFLAEIVSLEFQLMAETRHFVKRAGVGDRDRCMIGKDSEPV